MAKAKPPDRHQQRGHRSSGAKQRVTSSSVWQSRGRRLVEPLPERRLYQLLQGERAEATAFWQALPARMAPQTHSARPVNLAGRGEVNAVR